MLSAGATLTTKIFFEVVLRLGFVLNRGLLLLWLGLHELRLTAAPGDQAGSADTNSLRGQASDQMARSGYSCGLRPSQTAAGPFLHRAGATATQLPLSQQHSS